MKPDRDAPEQQAHRSRSPLWAAAALVCGLALAASYQWTGAGAGQDSLSANEIATRAAAFAAAGPIQLDRVPAQDRQQAVSELKLPAPQAAALLTEVDAGRTDLVYITVWDDVAEDGDVVELSSDGLTVSVPILNQPSRIALPMPRQGVVNIAGVRDGGGGITVGAMSGSARVALPYMQMGERKGIPVRSR